MKKTKKLFLSILSSILPLFTFATASCTNVEIPKEPSDPNPPHGDPYQKIRFSTGQETKWKVQEEIQEIYDKIHPKFKELATINDFNTPTSSFNWNKIRRDDYYILNQNFFKSVDASKKLANWTKIQTKEDFDKIIIKRFQELNNREDLVISETEIREEFQKMFLKNQDVYEVLKNNDIYIDDDDAHTSFEYYYMVPFESDDSIELNIIDEVITRYITTDIIPYTTWAVFSLPKNKTVKVKEVSSEYKNTELEFLINFKKVLIEWYNTKFKQHINQ